MVEAQGRQRSALDVALMQEVLHGRLMKLAQADLASSLFCAYKAIAVRFGVWIAGVEPSIM